MPRPTLDDLRRENGDVAMGWSHDGRDYKAIAATQTRRIAELESRVKELEGDNEVLRLQVAAKRST